MRKIVPLLIIAIITTSCICDGVNEILYATAHNKRVATQIKQDNHKMQKSDWYALAEKRLQLKETTYNVIMISGIVLTFWVLIAGVYWLLGSVHINLQKQRFMMIQDPQELRFPVLVRENSVVVIETGERYQLDNPAPPNHMLTASSTLVQIKADKHKKGRSEIIDVIDQRP